MQEGIERLLKGLMSLVGATLLSACGGGSGGSGDVAILPPGSPFCADMQARADLVALFQKNYLWYQELPALSLEQEKYCNLQTLIDDLRKKPQDRFSYIQNADTYQTYFEEGTYQGFGFGAQRLENQQLRVLFVYDDSAAGRALIQRGDVITHLQGAEVSALSKAEVDQKFAEASAAKQLSLTVQSQTTGTRELTLALGLVKINTVLDSRVITSEQGAKVAYLAFKAFITPSVSELQQAFAELAPQNPTEMVLDMRYNGGGRIDVAGKLAGWVAADRAGGQTLTTLRHNNKLSQLDESFDITAPPDGQGLSGLQRLYVLASEETCSASELIVNGLRPFMPVVLVGEKTCGKPFGSYPLKMQAKNTTGGAVNFSVSPLMFSLVNSQEQGDYADGLPVQCEVADAVAHDFGDPNEVLLKTALAYIDSDACPTAEAANPVQSSRRLAPETGKFIAPWSLDH